VNVGGEIDVDVSVGSSSPLSPPKLSSRLKVDATTELEGVGLTGDIALYLAWPGKIELREDHEDQSE
jgi:hypothetical protein